MYKEMDDDEEEDTDKQIDVLDRDPAVLAQMLMDDNESRGLKFTDKTSSER